MTEDKKINVQTRLFEEPLSLAKPFMKWAGGKGQLLQEIKKRLPKFTNNVIEQYFEPFVGGGAVFFFLKSNFNIKKSYLIDNNKELLIGYRVIQEDPKELISQLKNIEDFYLQKEEIKRKKYFYQIRDEYNSIIDTFDYNNYNNNWIQRAVYMIFLNRTCFNGLFRQNKKGEFNVPFGKYKNPTICNQNNILEVHKALTKTKIIHGDFESIDDLIDDKSFIYFDPPYRPISKTANFTDYSSSGFNDEEQIRLARFYRKMDSEGCKMLLSNSDPKNHDPDDDFFDDLYKGFIIERINAKRAISSKVETRGNITELLIRNYKLT